MNYNNAHVNNVIRKMAIPYNSEANVIDIYEAIFNHCKAAGMNPERFAWNLTADNVLTVDGKPLKRVGPKVYPYLGYDYTGPDYEGMILARQHYDD